MVKKIAKLKKLRVDVALVEWGLVESRAKAQALIMAGKVFTGEEKILKAGQTITDDKPLEVRGKEHPWVSRGGMKLSHGLEHFPISADDKIMIDVGSSTGGFTDVALTNGATKVYAVDVGHGQLDWKLRNDDRVVVMEKTNARYLTAEDIPDPIGLIVCDASFISLKTVLPAAMRLAVVGAEMIALIKPQFEVGKGQVGKKGVVRDPALHKAVCDDIADWLNGLPNWEVLGVETSPITGPEGNIEFLIGARKTGADQGLKEDRNE
jgi:23S rRNA (cytidine1920-2'-O)/16S rRNA (cytidine1409-2'-O)-methyltransferase